MREENIGPSMTCTWPFDRFYPALLASLELLNEKPVSEEVAKVYHGLPVRQAADEIIALRAIMPLLC